MVPGHPLLIAIKHPHECLSHRGCFVAGFFTNSQWTNKSLHLDKLVGDWLLVVARFCALLKALLQVAWITIRATSAQTSWYRLLKTQMDRQVLIKVTPFLVDGEPVLMQGMQEEFVFKLLDPPPLQKTVSSQSDTQHRIDSG